MHKNIFKRFFYQPCDSVPIGRSKAFTLWVSDRTMITVSHTLRCSHYLACQFQPVVVYINKALLEQIAPSQQSAVIATETEWPAEPKYLQPGPLQENLADSLIYVNMWENTESWNLTLGSVLARDLSPFSCSVQQSSALQRGLLSVPLRLLGPLASVQVQRRLALTGDWRGESRVIYTHKLGSNSSGRCGPFCGPRFC